MNVWFQYFWPALPHPAKPIKTGSLKERLDAQKAFLANRAWLAKYAYLFAFRWAILGIVFQCIGLFAEPYFAQSRAYIVLLGDSAHLISLGFVVVGFLIRRQVTQR